MRTLFAGVFALSSVLLSGLALTAENAYTLYPVAGMFTASGGTVDSSRLDADFTASTTTGGQIFSEKFRAAFPESIAKITDENKRRTFAVSLQIARASKYVVAKPDGTDDVYLPVTGSIYFTNMLSGEVLYTVTQTDIKQVTLRHDATSAGSPKIQALFRENYEGLVGSLIALARTQFKPANISAVVKGEWKGLAIVDGGSKQGINREDTLSDPQGNELRVLSTGPSYAVAHLELGKFQRGGVFSKVSNQTIAEINKPRVLPIVERAPADFPEQTLIQLLSDSLGAKSAISLILVNPTFQNVLTTVAGKADISQEVIHRRELPNFYFRLSIPDPIEYEVPTNLSHKTRRVYEAIALAQLVERNGRVLYAGMGKSRIEDEITSNIGFNSAARREVVIKNALLDLATKFGAEMKFTEAEATVTSGGKEIAIRDNLGILSKGASSRVYRSIGKVDGIANEVRVPIWEINVTDASDGIAKAIADLPVVEAAPEPATGDVVFLTGTTSEGMITRKRFAPCAEQKLGAVDVAGYGDIAQNIFASRFKGPYFTRGLGAKAAELIRAGTGFKADAKITDTPADYCVEPVYRIDMADPLCASDACADTLMVRLTYRIRFGDAAGEIKVRQGLEAKMTTAYVPKATPAFAKKSVLQADLLDEILKLDSGIVQGLNKETY